MIGTSSDTSRTQDNTSFGGNMNHNEVTRLELIDMVQEMMDEGNSAEEIVDEIIAALTPDDGDECPVCGILP